MNEQPHLYAFEFPHKVHMHKYTNGSADGLLPQMEL